jgi:hypothetical protein
MPSNLSPLGGMAIQAAVHKKVTTTYTKLRTPTAQAAIDTHKAKAIGKRRTKNKVARKSRRHNRNR